MGLGGGDALVVAVAASAVDTLRYSRIAVIQACSSVPHNTFDLQVHGPPAANTHTCACAVGRACALSSLP